MDKEVIVQAENGGAFEFWLVGNKDGGLLNLKVIDGSCIQDGYEIIIGFEDNTTQKYYAIQDTCDAEVNITYMDLGFSSTSLYPVKSLLKFKEQKIRGISIQTNKGLVRALISDEAKNYIYDASKCMLN